MRKKIPFERRFFFFFVSENAGSHFRNSHKFCLFRNQPTFLCNCLGNGYIVPLVWRHVFLKSSKVISLGSKNYTCRKSTHMWLEPSFQLRVALTNISPVGLCHLLFPYQTWPIIKGLSLKYFFLFNFFRIFKKKNFKLAFLLFTFDLNLS